MDQLQKFKLLAQTRNTKGGRRLYSDFTVHRTISPPLLALSRKIFVPLSFRNTALCVFQVDGINQMLPIASPYYN